jgi:general secretion pathway protein A
VRLELAGVPGNEAEMYVRHFALKTEAFSLSPDPSFLYLSPGHAEALAALEIGLRGRRGLMVMTGEVGTGKTTLLYSLLTRIGADVRTAYIANTKLSFDDMLQQALGDFGVPCPSRDRLEQLTALNAFLHGCATDDTTAALVIDEAQNLDADAFEHLRLLSNFETFTSKLLQIVLVGQPELEARLRSPRLRQVAERVAVHCHIAPLDRSESRNYIEHRLRCAGGSLHLFTPSAARLAIRRSQGIPRRINIICHNALLFAYGDDAPRVLRSHVLAAVRAREGRAEAGLKTWFGRRLAAAGALLAALGAVVISRAEAPTWLGMAGMQWPNPLHTVPPQAVGHAPEAGAPDSTDKLVAFAPEEAAPATQGTAQGADLPGTVADVDPGTPGTAPDTDTEARSGAELVERPDDTTETIAAAPAPAQRLVRVRPGATLYSLTKEIYGLVNPDLIDRILAANPQIVDSNLILAGDTLRFPEVERERPLAGVVVERTTREDDERVLSSPEAH